MSGAILRDAPVGREQYPGSAPGPDREVEKGRLQALVGGGWWAKTCSQRWQTQDGGR